MNGCSSFDLLPTASFVGWLDDDDVIVLEAQDVQSLGTYYRLSPRSQ